MPKPNTSVYIDAEQLAALKLILKEQGSDFSKFMRRKVHEALEEANVPKVESIEVLENTNNTGD